MICRNCSAVIPDDSEQCPSCGRDPAKRGRSRKTTVIILLLSLVIFSSCVSIAVKINRTPAEPTSASSASAASESTAFFVLKTTITQTDTTVPTTASTKVTESTAEKETKSFKNFEVETFAVNGTADIGKTERARIKADKADFQKNGEDYIETICRSIISKNSYAWLTVDFGDSTGIVFLADNTGGADYGKIDENGLIRELYGSFIISRQADYSYYPVLLSTTAEPTQTTGSEQTESQKQTTETTENAPSTAASSTAAETKTTKEPKTVTETKPTESKTSEPKTTTEMAAAKAAPSDSVSDSTVYITATGSKFHRDGCASLNKSKIKIDRDKAISEGYEPCKRCKP
ncbi:MAG: hypothetical protein ACI4XE_05040 [Acutalibacteraceae bacterium]